MRRLTDLPFEARNGAERDDRGVATIFLILAMTAILVGAALAIDVGRYVLEARSAQNSADATALAVATDCALTGSPIADYTPYRKDGQSISAPACVENSATITVTKIIDQTFLKQSIGDVDRPATAKWGTIKTAATLPIVIADCEFTAVLGQTVTMYLDDPKPQSGCSSLPGGFSQLLGDGCNVTITAGNLAPGKTGGDLQKDVPCITDPNGPPALPYPVLIPIYNAQACADAGCKGKGPYLIKGFALLNVTGYSFNGNAYDGSLDKKCPDDRNRGKYCIRGTYENWVTTRGTPGPSEDFGVSQVYLSD
ncbi:MAG TPA: TadE/TadG family type IV pilus assembly protein [Ilumatobacteraceae bacterium]|nr:TadE/TadG family type IV pilus assembly protein [Ilumatobacteraceae bacterium]